LARILIADDSDAIRLLLVRILAGDGHEVVQAADGLSAFRSLTTEPFDLAVLDVMMPALDGLTLCRMLRDVPGLGHLAVVIVSADASEAAALASGADAFFSKPFSPTSLRLVVTRLAGGNQSGFRQARRGRHAPIGTPSTHADVPAMDPAVVRGSESIAERRGEARRPMASRAPADALIPGSEA
jgi:CheY-like chemotaxis protein